MELILTSNNENSLAQIVALAKKLDVNIQGNEKLSLTKEEIAAKKKHILSYKGSDNPSFGDAAEWERKVREDRELPFYRLCILLTAILLCILICQNMDT